MAVPFEYDRKRAMKQTDFTPCVRCGRGVMHAGVPLFYRVTVERFGVDGNAVRRHAGLEMMIGSPSLAHAMGQDADIGLPIGNAERGLLCESCAHNIYLSFGQILESLSRSTAKDGEAA